MNTIADAGSKQKKDRGRKGKEGKEGSNRQE